MNDEFITIRTNVAPFDEPFTGMLLVEFGGNKDYEKFNFSCPLSCYNFVVNENNKIPPDFITFIRKKHIILPEIDGSWKEPIQGIKDFIVPFPLQSSMEKTPIEYIAKLKIENLVLFYYLSVQFHFTELSTKIESEVLKMQYSQSIYALKYIKSFIFKGIDLPSVVLPIVINTANHINEYDTENESIYNIIFSENFIPIIEFLCHQNHPDYQTIQNWIIQIYGNIKSSKEIISIIRSLKDDPRSNFIKWATLYPNYTTKSLVITDVKLLEKLSADAIFKLFELIEIDNMGLELAPFAINCLTLDEPDKDKAKGKILQYLTSKDLLDLKNRSGEELISILSTVVRNHLDKSIFSRAASELVSDQSKLEKAFAFNFNPLDFTWRELSEALNAGKESSTNKVFCDVASIFLASGKADGDKKAAEEFASLIEDNERAPLWAFVCLDCLNRSGSTNIELIDKMKGILQMDQVCTAVDLASEFERFNISQETLQYICKETKKDVFSHSKVIKFVSRFKIPINAENLVPLNELILPDVLWLCSANGYKSERFLKTVFLFSMKMFDFFESNEIELLAKIYRPSFKDLFNPTTDDEEKIAYFASLCDEPTLVRPSRLPIQIIKTNLRFSKRYEKRFKSYPNFSEEDWCKLEPARISYIRGTLMHAPYSLCVIVFSAFDAKLEEQIRKQFIFAGVTEISVNFDGNIGVDAINFSAFVLWKPSFNSITTSFERIYNNLIELKRPISVSANLVKEYASLILPDVNVTFEDKIQRIQFSEISNFILPRITDVCPIECTKDEVFGSIPFSVLDANILDDKIVWKNGRVFGAIVQGGNLSVFNFDLGYNEDPKIYNFMRAKYTANCIISLLCDSNYCTYS